MRWRHGKVFSRKATYTDASRTGVGFCLVQTEVGSKIPLLIQAGSRFLSPAEKNYAVVELKLLAIQLAIEKCRLYLAGTEFTVIKDHQPLLGILNRNNLNAINNVRIQRLMAKLLGYSFRVEWIPGKNHCIFALQKSGVRGTRSQRHHHP